MEEVELRGGNQLSITPGRSCMLLKATVGCSLSYENHGGKKKHMREKKEKCFPATE